MYLNHGTFELIRKVFQGLFLCSIMIHLSCERDDSKAIHTATSLEPSITPPAQPASSSKPLPPSPHKPKAEVTKTIPSLKLPLVKITEIDQWLGMNLDEMYQDDFFPGIRKEVVRSVKCDDDWDKIHRVNVQDWPRKGTQAYISLFAFKKQVKFVTLDLYEPLCGPGLEGKSGRMCSDRWDKVLEGSHINAFEPLRMKLLGCGLFTLSGEAIGYQCNGFKLSQFRRMVHARITTRIYQNPSVTSEIMTVPIAPMRVYHQNRPSVYPSYLILYDDIDALEAYFRLCKRSADINLPRPKQMHRDCRRF